MSQRTTWPPGLDPRKDTTNSTYGAYIPNHHLWERTYLQYYAPHLRNKNIEKFRQRLTTSNEEYGYHWAKSRTPLGSPFVYHRRESNLTYPLRSRRESLAEERRAREARQIQSEPVDFAKAAEHKAEEFWEKIHGDLGEGESRDISLPPISDVSSREMLPRFEDNEVKVGGRSFKLPEIRQINIQLHMADDSVIKLRTLPNRPYQFH